jgi:hypothetical protein
MYCEQHAQLAKHFFNQLLREEIETNLQKQIED